MAYQDIGGGYKFAMHRVGASLMNPDGVSVYFQPGDDTAAIVEMVEALSEIDAEYLPALAHIALSDYFD